MDGRRRDLRACHSTYHGVKATDYFKGEVHPSIGHLLDYFVDGFAVVQRVDALSCTQFFGLRKLVFVDVHSDDPGRSCCFTANDDRQPNTSKAKHSTGGAWGHLCLQKIQKTDQRVIARKCSMMYKTPCFVICHGHSDLIIPASKISSGYSCPKGYNSGSQNLLYIRFIWRVIIFVHLRIQYQLIGITAGRTPFLFNGKPQ